MNRAYANLPQILQSAKGFIVFTEMLQNMK